MFMFMPAEWLRVGCRLDASTRSWQQGNLTEALVYLQTQSCQKRALAHQETHGANQAICSLLCDNCFGAWGVERKRVKSAASVVKVIGAREALMEDAVLSTDSRASYSMAVLAHGPSSGFLDHLDFFFLAAQAGQVCVWT